MFGACFLYLRKVEVRKRDFIGFPHVQAVYCCNINTIRGSSFALANTYILSVRNVQFYLLVVSKEIRRIEIRFCQGRHVLKLRNL